MFPPGHAAATWPARAGHEDKVCSVEDAGEYLLPYFFGARNELLYLLCLDAKGKVLGVPYGWPRAA